MKPGTTTIRVSGLIDEDDPKRLRALLEQLTKSATGTGTGAGERRRVAIVAELSSPGGDVYAGLEMGYLFREFDVATVVRKGDLCLSSCALAFLGGSASHLPPTPVPDRRIEIGGQVGFHSFTINPESPMLASAPDARAGLVVGFNQGRGGSSLLVRYAGAMALDPAFIARMIGRPPEVFEYIDSDGEFEDLGACPISADGGGVLPPVPPPATVATNICNHATGGMTPVDDSHAREMPAHEIRRNLLEHLRDNVESQQSLAGGLVKQLQAALAGRDDRKIEAIYEDMRATGVPLLEVMGSAWEVTGYAAGAYQFQCHVSVAPGDPDRYDVVLAGPTGLSRAFKAAPRKCPGLFLYDRDEMLNPEKK